MIWVRTSGSFQLIDLDSVARIALAPSGAELVFYNAKGQAFGESRVTTTDTATEAFEELQAIMARGIDGVVQFQGSASRWTPLAPYRAPRIWLVTPPPIQLVNLSLASKFEIPARPTGVQVFGSDGGSAFATIQVCRTWPCLPAIAGEIWCCNTPYVGADTPESRSKSDLHAQNALDARTQFLDGGAVRCLAYNFLDSIQKTLVTAISTNRSGLLRQFENNALDWVEPIAYPAKNNW